MSVNAASSEIHAYLAVLRRQWRIVVALALVALLAALLNSWRVGPSYRSQSEVLVRPVVLQSSDFARPAPVNMDDEQQVATSAEVTNRAAVALSMPSVVGQQVTVESAPTVHTLLFTATASRRAEAQRIAQAFVAAYLEFRTSKAMQDLEAATKSLDARLEELKLQIQNAKRELDKAPPDSPGRDSLRAELSSLSIARGETQQTRDGYLPAEDIRVGEILQPATYPVSSSSPGLARTAVFAVFVGLALGVGIAFVRERLDSRVRGHTELVALLGAPVLGAIPKRRPARRWPLSSRGASHADDTTPQVVGLSETADPMVSEAYRRLRRKVIAAAAKYQMTNLVVTGPANGHATTVTTAALGASLARAGKRVMLISAETEEPRLPHYFAVENRNGNGGAAVVPRDQVPVSSDPASVAFLWSHLWVLQNNLSLLLLPDGFDLFDPELADRLMAETRQIADFVLIDTPPMLEEPDVLELLRLADGVLLVADAEHATRESIIEARYQLEEADARLVGAVVTNAGGEFYDDPGGTALAILPRGG
jgi:capsular polysaccharide biosynthesis protein/Mrp family chromosome partitioning ATPase